MVKDLFQLNHQKLSLDINFELNFDNPVIGNQKNKINVYEDNLKRYF